MISDEKRIGAESPRPPIGWNEIDFVPWQSFSRMAPAILGLEITRLGELIQASQSMGFRNALVKTRFEIQSFVDQLREAGSSAKNVDTVHLEAAILNLPVGYRGLEPNTRATLEYILDRLQYVHNRIRFVYQ